MSELIVKGKSKKSYSIEQPWYFKHDAHNYPDDFWKWIQSINSGFINRTKFEPFEIYRKQAREFILKFGRYPLYGTKAEKEEYIKTRKDAFSRNALYFVNSMGFLKDGSDDGGKLKFEAVEAQEILCYLDDLMVNLCEAKARQIGATSLESLLSIRDIICFKSYYIKYIAQDELKTIEIFGDKIRFGYEELEPWAKPTAMGFSKLEINLQKKGKNKGDITGMRSRIQVQVPKRDAINGGSPQKVLVDEAGEQNLLNEMINEGRPTLFGMDVKTKKIIQKRVLKTWGTGGNMDKGGGKFENFSRPIFENWAKKSFIDGIVPIFLDYMARPGMTEEHYQKEKERVYADKTADREKNIIQFHQHYPKDLDDVFMHGANTIIAKSNIQIQKEKIRNKSSYIKHGYFEPIYNYTVKYPETYVVPHPITGAQFIECDEDDPRAICRIMVHPAAWVNRFYMGIDPINSETGNSEFSASIWDKNFKTIAANISFRDQNYKLCYLQAHLMSMYYAAPGKKKFLRELVENVIGDDYYNTRLELGTPKEAFVKNYELPENLKQANASGKEWGISNKSNNAGAILTVIIMVARTYWDRLYNMKYFNQIGNFVEKKLKNTGNTHRETRFQAQNKDRHKDDIIFSDAFAYICADCHSEQPREVTVGDRVMNRVVKTTTIQNASTGWRQKRITKRV